MNYKEIKNLINKRLKACEYINSIAVEFPKQHKTIYMTEPQIRALCLEAAIIYKELGEKAFTEFTSSFVIYNGKRKSRNNIMTILPNGHFEEPFKSGFYSTNGDMARALIQLKNKK